MKYLIPIMLSLFVLAACSSGGGEMNAVTGKNIAGDSSTGISATDASTVDAPMDGSGTTGANAVEQPSPEKAVLSFSSFDGGGHEYSVEIEDPEILTYTSKRDYGAERDELETGSPYWMIFTFTGLKPGTTTVSVYGRSPIIENNDSIYTAVVDENLNVTLKSVRKISTFFMYRDADIDYNTYSVSYGQDGYHVSVNYEEEQKIDEESVDALIAVIDEYGVERWNGFSESERHGPVEESFLLEARLTDGTYIWARGDNVFPENYEPAINKMQEILDNAKIW